jgi:hypothetical protein
LSAISFRLYRKIALAVNIALSPVRLKRLWLRPQTSVIIRTRRCRLSCGGISHGKSLGSIRATLALAEEFLGRFDFFCPDPFFVDAAVVELHGIAPPVGIPEHDNELLRTILSLQMPRLQDLRLQDIAAARDDETFAVWRAALRKAIHEADQVSARIDPQGERLRVVREEMAVARPQLMRGIAGSPVLSASQGEIVRLGIGTVIDLIISPKKMLGDGVKRVGEMLSDAITGRSRPVDALIQHFALFE